VLRDVMSALADMLYSIPPVRFVMGLVDPRWRPLWAAVWLAVIAYILSRTMNQLALRRARLRLLEERAAPESPTSKSGGQLLAQDQAEESLQEQSRILKPAATPTRTPPSTPPIEPAQTGGTRIPLPVIAIALVVGGLVVALTSLLLPKRRVEPSPPSSRAAADTIAPADTGLDVRWRSGRKDDDDCIGTFEVTRGDGARARFVAFAMDTTGAIMARDSARVASAVPGLLVEFRFRHVDCEEIADWQLQVATPKGRTN
jgi:hypothetical protein